MLPELSEDFTGIAEGDSGIPFDLSDGYEVGRGTGGMCV